jgi:hypothetical protein
VNTHSFKFYGDVIEIELKSAVLRLESTEKSFKAQILAEHINISLLDQLASFVAIAFCSVPVDEVVKVPFIDK